MPCAPAKPAEQAVAPHSKLASYFIERNYKSLGCDDWDTRRVQILCAKLGDTPAILAARLRLRPSEFLLRMKFDSFTKQDGLIFTLLEREIDFLKGDVIPDGKLIP